MKKTTLLIFILTLFLSSINGYSQKVVIIGMNHISSGAPNDGFTFVATENIPAGEVIYFTDNEYSDAANAFTFNGAPTGEAVIRYVVGAGGLATGVVVFMHETSSNAFTISCSSGNCGTSTISTSFGNGSFNLATNGDVLYAYSDTDENVLNGVTQIYSAMYTGSGEAPAQNGGNIPTDQNPTNDYPNAVLVQGFPNNGNASIGPDRVEYKFNPSSLRDGISQTALENASNYLSYASSQDLSIVPFTNLSLSGSNPVATVAVSPNSLSENSGASFTYTFTLNSNAASNITLNFSVGGTAILNTDYSQSGAATFSASTGTVVIASGTNSKTITITPTGDTDLEPDETVILTLVAGTGYDAGSPSIATATIENDDSINITPLVAITGLNHLPTEGFSFVALDDILEGTEIYFTEDEFNNNNLTFNSGESVAKWTVPVGGILRGEVIVATEVSNNFTLSCDNGNCGIISFISGSAFDLASTGETFSAYSDNDSDPSNGITQIHSSIFTGANPNPGGNIPTIEDPTNVYIGAVVVDGFPTTSPIRTEYDITKRGVTVDQANFQNTSNWVHAQTSQILSTTVFNNIIVATGSANPIATVAIATSSVAEDSGTGMVYTFTLSSAASGSDIVINFDVSGTADLTTDYSVAGATSFTSSAGSVTISDGDSSAAVTITPVVDLDVEILETVQLQIASGTGYDGGSPNSATGTISNDDTSDSKPLVAITGMNHVSPDGFSFVAAKDIPANSIIYFTENEFDNTTLLFNTGEAVLKYTSPGSVISTGDVIVIKETSSNVFTIVCNGSSGASCGSIQLVSNNLAHDTSGESLYAYEDNDDDPTNGVLDIYSVLFTGLSSSSGGSIPVNQDPSGIYLKALVIDGFPAIAPNRTEYKFASNERGGSVDQVNFEDVSNWLHGQTNQDLSAIPFAALNILQSTIISVDVPVNDTYITGQNLDFTINFNENVTVDVTGGIPQLAITIGTTTIQAIYQSGSGTKTLLFRYTILEGELDTDGIAIGTLDDNDGTLKNSLNIDANLTLNSVGTTTAVLVDAVAPTVTSVAVPPNATYIAGENLDFTINFSESITVDVTGGTPQLSITIGATTVQAVYQSGSGTGALLFRYTVQTGELDTDGIAVGTLANNSGTLKDAVGNNATLTLNSVGTTTAVLVDAVAPTVTSVAVPPNATYIAGENLDFTINFSENITVDITGGTPQLSITIGATTVQAVYQSGTGTGALLFRYTVQTGELDTDGIAVGTLVNNSGTLKDAVGNNATLTLNSVGTTTAVLVGSTLSVNNFELDLNKIRLFPNPSTHFIQVSGLTKTENYRLFNMLGVEIAKGSISDVEKIDTQNLIDGVYFIKLDSGSTLRFIKE